MKFIRIGRHLKKIRCHNCRDYENKDYDIILNVYKVNNDNFSSQKPNEKKILVGRVFGTKEMYVYVTQCDEYFLQFLREYFGQSKDRFIYPGNANGI